MLTRNSTIIKIVQIQSTAVPAFISLAIFLSAILPACTSPVAGEQASSANADSDNPEVVEKFRAVYLPVDIMGKIIQATQVKYIPDPRGKDYWQTPAETLKRGAGDCEDIAILLQHELAKLDLHAEVVLGLRSILEKTGHAWCEFSYEGKRYVIEPSSGICYHRKALIKGIYFPAEKISTVAQKVKNYHKRTGIWVNTNYKDWIKAGCPEK